MAGQCNWNNLFQCLALEPLSQTNFLKNLVYLNRLCHADVIHSDWLKQVILLGTSHQSELYQRSIVTLF